MKTFISRQSFLVGKRFPTGWSWVRAVRIRAGFLWEKRRAYDPAAGGSGPGVLGRVGFTGDTITDGRGRFAPELLALHLFRKPHAS